MNREHVQDQVQCSVRVQIEVANETNGFAPDLLSAGVNSCWLFCWQTCTEGMTWTHAVGDLGDQLGVSF